MVKRQRTEKGETEQDLWARFKKLEAASHEVLITVEYICSGHRDWGKSQSSLDDLRVS